MKVFIQPPQNINECIGNVYIDSNPYVSNFYFDRECVSHMYKCILFCVGLTDCYATFLRQCRTNSTEKYTKKYEVCGTFFAPIRNGLRLESRISLKPVFFNTVHLETTDGLDFKTPKFLCHVIYICYRLDEENPYIGCQDTLSEIS